MIIIQPQPEPAEFDVKVRQKGLKWLEQNSALSKMPPHWQECLPELSNAYHSICAYYSIIVDDITGAHSVDHFKPKSKYPHLAYEWVNYRFACRTANSKKNDFEDVLDPFSLPEGLFCIHFGTGEIYINAEMDVEIQQEAQTTINRLALNDNRLKNRRKKDFNCYQNGKIFLDELKQLNPFVWAEILRQDLVRKN